MLLGKKNLILLESLFTSLSNRATPVRNMHLWDEQQSRACGPRPWKKLANLLCQCQTAFFDVDSCFELLVPPGDWHLIVSTCEHGHCYSGQLVSTPTIGMPHLTVLDRARAIGQLQAGVSQNQVAALFGVSPSTICKLKAKFYITGDVRNRPQSGRPKKTAPQEDRFLILSALRNHMQSYTDLQSGFAGLYGRWLSAQTIRNRLHAANLWSHRAARRLAMTALHHQARLRWCWQYVHWNLNM